MVLLRLAIQKFRNLQPASLTFSPTVNFIYGENAQGKTNLLEAIYLLCLARSFRAREDAEAVPFGEEEFFVEGFFRSDEGTDRRVAVLYNSTGKQISVDDKRLHRYSALVGEFPVVCLWAGDQEITVGAPQQRRRFFDMLLAQSGRRHLDDLKQFDHVLRQRNSVLAAAAAGRSVDAQLEVWNQQFVHYSARIMRARRELVAELNPLLRDAYRQLTGNQWTLSVDYRPNVSWSEDAEAALLHAVDERAAEEKRRGQSLVGPQRDEFLFFIADYELLRFGSRG